MLRIIRQVLMMAAVAAGTLTAHGTVHAQLSNLFSGDDSGPSSGGVAGFGGGGAEEAVAISAWITPHKPDQAPRLFVSAVIEPGWNIYSTTQPPGGPLRTVISVNPPAGVSLAGPWMVTPAPNEKPEPAFNNLIVEYHDDRVTWFVPLSIDSNVDRNSVEVRGTFRYQACDANSCYPPVDKPFVARVGRGEAVDVRGAVRADPPSTNATPGQEGSDPGGAENIATPPRLKSTADPPESTHPGSRLDWTPYATFAQFKSLLDPSFDPAKLEENVQGEVQSKSLVLILALAFVGGLVLNVMPCVLPVIGLKVLSFVEQAGHSRARAFALNVAYAAGLLSIFLLLATMAAFLGLGWGSLFTMGWFNVFLAAVVFAMALSFLGVWEIPIPGFVGSGNFAEAAEQEGLSGAFSKGVVTTILATPCTGPFMGTALVWALAQPTLVIYAVFMAIGLGMASPYLLIGVFPQLVRFLPKPGAWMDTFKQVMGFVLMGTVVFILTFVRPAYVVPTIGLLFAVWAGCWWIARVPFTAPSNRKASAWLEAGVFIALMWVVLFPGVNELISTSGFWDRFAFPGVYDVMESRIDRLVKTEAYRLDEGRGMGGEGRATSAQGPNTVLVAFTADWCATCKTLEAQVLDTPPVRKMVAKNRVLPMKADWTNREPEVTRLLSLLGAKQVPVVAVFPADDPSQPTGVFYGGYDAGYRQRPGSRRPERVGYWWAGENGDRHRKEL